MANPMQSSISYQDSDNLESNNDGGEVKVDEFNVKLGILIVPVICSFLVICLMFVMTSILHRRFSQLRAQEEKGIPTRTTREAISHSFEANRNQMSVTKEDLKYENNDIESGVDKREIDEDNKGGGLLILRVGEMDEMGRMDEMVESIDTEKTADDYKMESSQRITTTMKLTTKHVVPDCCAICLDFYKVGETVVWSGSLNNKSSKSGSCCPHVYHKECFIEYIMTHKGKGNPCPLCRQEYLPKKQPMK